jgi:hypothetical protein
MAARAPSLAHPAAVALATAKQPEDLDVVARRSHVRIPAGDECRHLEVSNERALVEILAHRRPDLAKQATEVLRTGCGPLVDLEHRRLLHERRRFGSDLGLLREHLRVDGIPADVGRDDDESVHEIRMASRDLHGDAAAERIADDVRLLEPEMADEGRDVVGHQLGADRAVDVGRPAVALEVGHDDLAVGGEGRKRRDEQLGRAESAVEHDDGPARGGCGIRTVGLVVEVDAVDVGVLAAPALLLRLLDRGHRGSPGGDFGPLTLPRVGLTGTQKEARHDHREHPDRDPREPSVGCSRPRDRT